MENGRDELFTKNNAYVPQDEMRPPGDQRAARYTSEDQAMLQKAKQQNKETTLLAQEALRTVQQTEEVAAGTLEELHRQDAQLDKVQKDYEQIEADLEESKQAINYMNRCCCLFCFACCCDCDGNAAKDKTRKARVEVRQELSKEEKKLTELTAQEKSAKAIAAARGQNGDEDGNRQELMGATQRLKGSTTGGSEHIGAGLEDEDRDEIQAEIRQQDDALDAISAHLDNIQNMAVAMGDTLKEQDTKIDTIANKTETVDITMKAQQKQMKKLK